MRTDPNRVLTTHTGSLPRPEVGSDADNRAAVAALIGKQLEIGIDVVGDGEVGKPSYATYVADRLTGFDSVGDNEFVRTGPPDLVDFPHYLETLTARRTGFARMPQCTGPIEYVGAKALAAQLDATRAALAEHPDTVEAFVTAASPGVISLFMPNRYYPDDQSYLEALGAAMKIEYDTIAAAGFVLQLDCPDLTSGWHTTEGDLDEHRRGVSARLEVLDHTLRDIPPQQLRLHVCWGNYEGPHHHDLPLRDVIDLLLAARPAGLSFEAANPRHEHEWTIFTELDVPEDTVLLPGVIDSTTNYIEHPELVAQRLRRFTDIVGKHRVLGSTDCGFATFAAWRLVDPDIAWAKLASLTEGAAKV